MTFPAFARFSLGLLTGALVGGAAVYCLCDIDDVRSIARRVGDVKQEVGEGSITGLVVNLRGKPLAGATIVLRRCWNSMEGSWWNRPGEVPDLTLAVELDKFVERYRRDMARTWLSTSGRDGRFSFERLPDAEFGIEGHLVGFTLATAKIAAGALRLGSSVKLVASRLGRLPVKITMPDGTAAAGASLYRYVSDVDGGRGGVGVQWYPGLDAVDLPEGEHTLSATYFIRRQPEPEALEAPELTVDIVGGETAAPAEFKLVASTGIRGTVRLASGIPVTGAVVYCMEHAVSREPDLEWLRRQAPQTIADPRFHFANLKPGTYLLGAARDRERGIETISIVNLTMGSVQNYDPILTPPKRGEEWILRARTADGEPVKNLTVFLKIDGDPARSASPLAATLYGEAFWFDLPAETVTLLKRRDPAAPIATLTLEAFYGETVKVPFDVGRKDIDVQFPEQSSLTVKVVNYKGSDLEGLLSVVLGERGSNSARVHPIEADGTVKIPRLTPGPYELKLRRAKPRPGDPYAHEDLEIRPVEVAVGGNGTLLTLPGPDLGIGRTKK